MQNLNQIEHLMIGFQVIKIVLITIQMILIVGFIVTSSLWLDLCNGLMMIFKKDYYSDLNKISQF